MIRRIVLFFMLLICESIFSQINITGKIIDKNNQFIAFADIVLTAKENNSVKTELTNENGVFQINTPQGTYFLEVRQFGKSIYNQEISINQNLDLGTIVVNETINQLKEVAVTGKRKLIERKVDRLVFNVENSIAATGGDALDALKVTPGIRVQNDAILIIGKSGMGLMIDDRLMQVSGNDLLNYLKSIPSDNIKSVEIITTPPSRYDAEGNSGLINIKLKKPKNDSWNASFRNTLKQATYLSDYIGGNFSMQKKKISLFTDISLGINKTIYENNITYDYPLSFWKVDLHNVNDGKVLIPSLTLNYKITDKTTLGIQYFGAINNTTIYDNSNSYVNNKQKDELINRYFSNGSTLLNYSRTSVNANGVTKFNDKGKTMSFDIDYLTISDKKENPLSSSIIDRDNNLILDNNVNNKSNLKIENYATKLDFVLPTAFANYEFGAKASFITTDSKVNLNFHDKLMFNDYLNQEIKFNYNENTQSVYFSTDKKIKKWEFKAGLRFESTQVKGFSITENITNNRNYYKLFPTFYTTCSLTENHSFSVTFNRRIDRPRYDYVNPARRYTAINSYVYGNPFL